MKAIFLDDAGVTGRKRSSDQPILLLGGIILDIDRMPDVHQRFDEIVTRTFNSISGASIPETHARPEIHARPIVSGKMPFGSLTMDERLKIFEDVYDLISEYDGHVCCFAFLKDNYIIGKGHPYHIAFQILCERIEEYLESLNEYALIFMDRNSEVEHELVRNLSSFRAQGFVWGTPRRERVTRIIGALHTVDSKHDTFIQIADLVVYGLYQMETLQDVAIDHEKGESKNSITLCLRTRIRDIFLQKIEKRICIRRRWPEHPFI